MSIDPKILARMRHESVPSAEYVDALTPLSGAPLVEHLPALVGSEKQVKWATTIRESVLALSWPPTTAAALRQIVDATWWIANKTAATTMKFKPPAPHQLVGGPPTPPKGRSTQPELSPTPAATVFDSCTGFAASVSRTPKQAEAAILALLAKLYKPPVRQQLQDRARAVKAEAEFEVGRDLDAINKLLG